MQAFERLKIVHLFSLTHYVIVLKYSLYIYIKVYGMNTRLHPAGILISKSSFSFCFFQAWEFKQIRKIRRKIKIEIAAQVCLPCISIVKLNAVLTSQSPCYFETFLSLCNICFRFFWSIFPKPSQHAKTAELPNRRFAQIKIILYSHPSPPIKSYTLVICFKRAYYGLQGLDSIWFHSKFTLV